MSGCTQDCELEQAIDELAVMEASSADVLLELADGDRNTILQACSAIAVVASGHHGEAALHAAAMFGLTIGVRAERIRQRRHGDHPGEVIA